VEQFPRHLEVALSQPRWLRSDVTGVDAHGRSVSAVANPPPPTVRL